MAPQGCCAAPREIIGRRNGPCGWAVSNEDGAQAPTEDPGFIVVGGRGFLTPRSAHHHGAATARAVQQTQPDPLTQPHKQPHHRTPPEHAETATPFLSGHAR